MAVVILFVILAFAADHHSFHVERGLEYEIEETEIKLKTKHGEPMIHFRVEFE